MKKLNYYDRRLLAEVQEDLRKRIKEDTIAKERLNVIDTLSNEKVQEELRIRIKIVKEFLYIIDTLLNENAEKEALKLIIENLKKFKDSKDPNAHYTQALLGLCYKRGIGVLKNKPKALELLQLAANAGNIIGIWYIATNHMDQIQNQKGLEKQKTIEKIIEMLSQGIEHGSLICDMYHAVCHLFYKSKVPDNAKEITILKKYFELEDPIAVFLMASCYKDGRFVRKDTALACAYFQKAADAGDFRAQYEIAISYYTGKGGVEQNIPLALKYCHMSADQGNRAAQVQLGALYFDGMNIEKDLGKAIIYYQHGAEAGEGEAFRALGCCYEIGKGVVCKDIIRAELLYLAAIDAGVKSAKNNLKKLLSSNKNLVRSKNAHQAFEKYETFLRAGNREFQGVIGFCYQMGIGVEMDHEQAMIHYKLSLKTAPLQVVLNDLCNIDPDSLFLSDDPEIQQIMTGKGSETSSSIDLRVEGDEKSKIERETVSEKLAGIRKELKDMVKPIGIEELVVATDSTIEECELNLGYVSKIIDFVKRNQTLSSIETEEMMIHFGNCKSSKIIPPSLRRKGTVKMNSEIFKSLFLCIKNNKEISDTELLEQIWLVSPEMQEAKKKKETEASMPSPEERAQAERTRKLEILQERIRELGPKKLQKVIESVTACKKSKETIQGKIWKIVELGAMKSIENYTTPRLNKNSLRMTECDYYYGVLNELAKKTSEIETVGKKISDIIRSYPKYYGEQKKKFEEACKTETIENLETFVSSMETTQSNLTKETDQLKNAVSELEKLFVNTDLHFQKKSNLVSKSFEEKELKEKVSADIIAKVNEIKQEIIKQGGVLTSKEPTSEPETKSSRGEERQAAWEAKQQNELMRELDRIKKEEKRIKSELERSQQEEAEHLALEEARELERRQEMAERIKALEEQRKAEEAKIVSEGRAIILMSKVAKPRAPKIEPATPVKKIKMQMNYGTQTLYDKIAVDFNYQKELLRLKAVIEALAKSNRYDRISRNALLGLFARVSECCWIFYGTKPLGQMAERIRNGACIAIEAILSGPEKHQVEQLLDMSIAWVSYLNSEHAKTTHEESEILTEIDNELFLKVLLLGKGLDIAASNAEEFWSKVRGRLNVRQSVAKIKKALQDLENYGKETSESELLLAASDYSVGQIGSELSMLIAAKNHGNMPAKLALEELGELMTYASEYIARGIHARHPFAESEMEHPIPPLKFAPKVETGKKEKVGKEEEIGKKEEVGKKEEAPKKPKIGMK